MKRRCKDIDISNVEFIRAAISEWRSHRTSKDMLRGDVRRLYRHFDNDEEKIAEELSLEIRQHHLKLAPVRIKEKIDTSNGKTRLISVESAKQQMLNYVAIRGLQPLVPRIGEYQCTCIPGRGTVWGMQQIMGWYADPSIRYVCQVDIRKNYNSISPEMMEAFLQRYICNDDLIWLIVTLDRTNPLGGLPIGSALSVYQDALYLSQAYHYIMEQMCKERRGKRLNLVKHTLFFVDDISMYCSSQKDARMADKLLRQYMATIGLSLHDGCRITRVSEKQYQDMLGFREYRSHVTMRRRDYLKLKSALNDVDKSISLAASRRLVSMNGFIKYSDSYRFRKKYHTKRLMKKARRYIGQHEKSTVCSKAGTGNLYDSGREDNSKNLPE